MNSKAIIEYIMNSFDGVIKVQAWGETSFFYNPNNSKPRGTYFCTIKDKDGENDKASGLFRDGIFRFNFGITKNKFLELFHTIPGRPLKGTVISGNYDFMQLDSLQPHPIYGWMCWVAILNPSNESFNNIEELLLESYALAVKRYEKLKASP